MCPCVSWRQVTNIQEVTLTANQAVSALRERRLKWRSVDGLEDSVPVVDQPEVSIDAPTVTLNPLQVLLVCNLMCNVVYLRGFVRVETHIVVFRRSAPSL